MSKQSRQRLVGAGIAFLVVVVIFLAWAATKGPIVPLIVLAAIVAGAITLFFIIAYRSQPLAFTDEKAIAARLEELRDGASNFYAIWSGTYGDVEVERYFEAERRALKDNESLHISRIINPSVIPPKHYHLLQSIKSEFGPRFQLYQDASIHSFELFVADYPDERDSVAVVVVNDLLAKRPKVGLVLDPDRNLRLVGAVEAVRFWFEAIKKNLRGFDPVAVERWDRIAPRYTEFVSRNANNITFLTDFFGEEAGMIGECLSELAGADRDLSVIEVGCGDGRALSSYVPALLAQNVSYVIGLDYAPGMVRAAQAELTSRLNSAEEEVLGVRELRQKTVFSHLDAFELRSVFDDGRLVRPDQFEAASLEVDPVIFEESRKVFCCLLNTIGVIEPLGRRKKVVESMLSALGVEDDLIITVFSADAFAKEAQDLYRGLELMLDTKVKDIHFDFPSATFKVATPPGYYSRWFEEADLRELLSDAAQSLGPRGRSFEQPTIRTMDAGGYFAHIRRTA
ncbi:MAG TPA: class I SAM-dependent methyltransferase [Solirubrobacterales bacterium]|jgi:SAM-dependent methyltransferase|nr:class I SAM-dependent methyltransferase [Solirubrobacterales bacterium]